MIIATHKEIDKGAIEIDSTVYKHMIIERPYTDSDLIFKEGKDFEDFNRPTGLVVMTYNTLAQNLQYIFQDAYRKGREDTLNQLMH